MSDADLVDLLALTMVPGVGPQTCRALLDHFGTAGLALDAPTSALKRVEGIGPKLAARIASARDAADAAGELALCRERGVAVVARGEDDYPTVLAEIPDPPSLLYRLGTFAEADRLAVAVVGARHCTPYGLRIAEKLGASLARVGLTVVSGLARGIDAAAHRGALRAGGRTIAVLANGLEQIYPPEHDGLAREVAQNGAVVSEMPMRQQPLAGLFPMRNRTISGLSLGVVVVEATPKSGSLGTAAHAVDQNRAVFAVPGPVDSLASVGCHGLLRDGARLVETVDDILDELGPKVRGAVSRPGSSTPAPHPAELKLSDQERSILARLGETAIGIDQLISETALGASQVMATLSILEMRRLVKRLPGQLFVRAGTVNL